MAETKKQTFVSFSDELADLVQEVAPSIYMIGYDEGTPRTGFQIDDSHVVSFARWAEPGEEVSLYTHSGEKRDGQVLGYDMTSGVVILSMKGPAIPLAEGDARVGAMSVTVALPSRDGIEARLGMIRCVGGYTRLPRGRRADSYIQTDGRAFPGFAGAPLLDPRGSLMGMTMDGGRSGDGFVLPGAQLKEIVSQLIKNPHLGLGRIGVVTQSAPLAENVSEARGGQGSGLLITAVEPESPAEAAGILVGDMIVAADGHKTEAAEDLMDALVGKNDQSVSITISRGGSIVSFDVRATKAEWGGGKKRMWRRGGSQRRGR